MWNNGLILSLSSLFSGALPSGGAAEPAGRVGEGMTSGELTPFIMAGEQSRADGISERLLFELIIQV